TATSSASTFTTDTLSTQASVSPAMVVSNITRAWDTPSGTVTLFVCCSQEPESRPTLSPMTVTLESSSSRNSSDGRTSPDSKYISIDRSNVSPLSTSNVSLTIA